MRATGDLFALLLASALGSACDCGTRTQSAAGQLRLSPSPLDFGAACVKPLDPSHDVAPVTRELSFSNGGHAVLGLATVQLEGVTPFTFPASWPRSLSSGETYELPISFLPVTSGNVSARLTVTDDASHAETISLTGSGSTAPPSPVALLHCPGGRPGAGGAQADRCFDAVNLTTSSNPLLWFADAVAGDAAEADLDVSNAGCAALNVASVVLDTSGSPSQSDAFVLLGEAGAPVPPGAYPAFSLKGGIDANGRGSRAVRVRFQPKLAGVFQANLTLGTNVPGTTSVAVHLLGTGVAPSLQLCATVGGASECSTAAVPATCDFSAATPCTGGFVARNSGGAPIDLTSIRLAQGNPQFTLGALPGLPATLAASGGASITVAYSPRAQYDYDLLTVTSSGGTLSAIVQGGQPPKLQVVSAPGDGADQVDFNKDASGAPVSLANGATATKTFVLANAGTGPLTVQRVYFRGTAGSEWPAGASSPVFSLSPPAANTVVPPGGSADVVVRFTDAPNGGPSGAAPLTADILIDSNDSLWPPPDGSKAVVVLAKTPCNPNPVAVLTGPTAAVSRGATVSLDGSASFDPKPDSAGSCQPGIACTASPAASGCPAYPITHWEWQLEVSPANAGPSVALAPTGFGASPTAQLTVGDCAPCSYVVRLWVYDDTPATAANPSGLQSTYADFTVNVQ